MAVSDIIVTPARVYYAPVGEALPDESSVAYGAAWGGNWTSFAVTFAALSMMYDAQYVDVRAELSTMKVKRFVSEEDYAFETELGEINLTNLALFAGGTVAATSAGASQVAYEQLPVGGRFQLTEQQWGFEGLSQDADGADFPLRVFLPIATAVLNGNMEFTRSDKTGIPFRVDCLADMSAAAGAQGPIFQRVTAVASS